MLINNVNYWKWATEIILCIHMYTHTHTQSNMQFDPLYSVSLHWLSRQVNGIQLSSKLNGHCLPFQRTLIHSHLSSLSHCGLILTYIVKLVCASLPLPKKKEKTTGNVQARNDLSSFPKKVFACPLIITVKITRLWLLVCQWQSFLPFKQKLTHIKQLLMR